MINSLCFNIKSLGKLKSENNVLTLFSDKFLKPFGQNHLLENYFSKFFLIKCSMKKFIVKSTSIIIIMVKINKYSKLMPTCHDKDFIGMV